MLLVPDVSINTEVNGVKRTWCLQETATARVPLYFFHHTFPNCNILVLTLKLIKRVLDSSPVVTLSLYI